jgi:hypothetical protein
MPSLSPFMMNAPGQSFNTYFSMVYRRKKSCRVLLDGHETVVQKTLYIPGYFRCRLALFRDDNTLDSENDIGP